MSEPVVEERSVTKKNLRKVYLDEDSGLHYMLGQDVVLFDNGVVVWLKDFNARSKNLKTVREVVDEAAKNPKMTGYNFEAARKGEGLIKINTTPQAKIHPVIPAKINILPSTKQEPVIERYILKEFFSAPNRVTILVLIVVGLLSMVMSMYHSFFFLNQVNGKPAIVAVISSFAMVLFAAIAFSAGAATWKRGGASWVGGTIFIVLGLATVTYLVFSTITVNYDQFTARDTVKEEQAVAKDTSVSADTKALTDKDNAITEARNDVTMYVKDSNSWVAIMNTEVAKGPDENGYMSSAYNIASRNYNNAQANIKTATARRDKLIGEKEALASKASTTIETVKTSRLNAYDFIAQRIGTDDSTIQFVVYVIPAAFFDIVSPFALSMVMLLTGKRKEKQKKSEEV